MVTSACPKAERRSAWHSLALGAFLAVTSCALAAQDLPNDIKRSVDTFTGDTIWETKYGRLDEVHGCSRLGLSLVWALVRGPTGRAERLQVDYLSLDTPFHKAHFLGLVAAGINADGHILEVKATPLSQHLAARESERHENAAFLLPDSTLRLVANARVPKLRLVGTEGSCDGIIETNMQVRLQQLLDAVR